MGGIEDFYYIKSAVVALRWVVPECHASQSGLVATSADRAVHVYAIDFSLLVCVDWCLCKRVIIRVREQRSEMRVVPCMSPTSCSHFSNVA